MSHSHMPAPRATRSARAPLGAQLIPGNAAAEAAALSPRTSEGPVPEWSPEAEPSDTSPAAHPPHEPSGSPPSRRSFRPVRWAEPADVRAWLSAAGTSFADLAALAREGSRRLKHRVLSRAELRRQRRDAERSFRALFAAAEAGLAGLSAEKGASGE